MPKNLNDHAAEAAQKRETARQKRTTTTTVKVPKVPRATKTPTAVADPPTVTPPAIPVIPPLRSTPTPALSTPGMPNILAANLFPTDWYHPSDKIPVLDEATYRNRMETIKGQQRAVGVLKENLILGRELLKAEGLSIDCEIEATTNDIKRQNLTTSGIKLQQAQTKTAIEQTKLTTLHQDLNGSRIESSLKEQVWNAKLENLSTGLDAARLHLHSQREALRQQFPSYSPSALPKVS